MHSLQCDNVAFTWALAHKLLCLNKTHLILPTCQEDCKVVFSWTRTSTHLMLFPVETVLLQCHDGSGRRCPLRTPTTVAVGFVPAEEVWGNHSRIRISPSTVTFSSYKFCKGKVPLTLCRPGRQRRYLQLQIWPEGWESTPGMLSSLVPELWVCVGWLSDDNS